jgi:hypothetical protein
VKKNVVILLLSLLTLNLYAKKPTGDKVDPFIEHKFKKEFSQAENVSWKVIQDISIATFIDNGQEKQVYYFSTGEIFGFGKMITRNLLPEAITEAVNRSFKSGAIQTAYEFKSPDAPTVYYVCLYTPRYSLIVSANEFGEMYVARKEKSK